MLTLSDLDRGWLAGIIEGEGCLTRVDASKGKSVRLSVSMTDRDIVERVHDLVGVGSYDSWREKHGTWKPMHRWSCARWDQVEPILVYLLPLMGERRAAKFNEVLADPPGRRGRPPGKKRPYSRDEAIEKLGRYVVAGTD